MRGLLLDFGGVLTTNVFDAFRDFCVAEGLEPETVKRLLRDEAGARELVRGLERGELTEEQFGEAFGVLLGLGDRTGLVDRMFAGLQPGRAHARGRARRPRWRASAPAWCRTRWAPGATTARRSQSCSTAW